MDIDQKGSTIGHIAQRLTQQPGESGRAFTNRSDFHCLDAAFAGPIASSGQFYD